MSAFSSASHCHCVFCLKPTSSSPTTITTTTTTTTKASSSSSVAQYLDLLERHVGGGQQQQQLLEPRRRSGPRRSFSVCRGCTSTLESFSNLYGQYKELELRLEWEVAKLSAVMEHANRVPLRGSFVKGCYGGEETGKGMMEEMYAWRRTLSKRCGSKLSASFPKVKLARRASPATPTIQHQFPVKREVEEVGASSPSSSQSHHHDVKDKTGDGGGGYDAEANLNQVMGINTTSIDIKYEIPSPLPHNSPEPDDPLLSSSITRSFAESPSSSPLTSTPSTQQSSRQIESSATSAAKKGVPSSSTSTSSSSQAHKWCDICSILFRTGYHFRSHYSRAHDFVRAGVDESEAARCSHCPAYFVSRRVLTLHVMRAHQQLTKVKSEDQRQRFPYRCSNCPKSFFIQSSLDGHVKSQHNLTGIRAADVSRCKVRGCSAVFRTSRQLHTHRLEFHARQLLKSPAGTPCICVECGKAFVNRYKLDGHKRSEHPPHLAAKSPTTTTPDSPKKPLLHEQQLSDSRTSYTVIKQEEEEPVPPPRVNAPPPPPPPVPPPHQCPQCGKVLSCYQSLYVHLLRHKGPEAFKYPCPICGKRFIASDKRKRHMVAVHKSTSTPGTGISAACHSSGAMI